MDGCASAGFENGGAKECRLLVVALDKMNPAIPFTGKKNPGHDTGKTAAAAKIDPGSRAGMQRIDLHAVDDMPLPCLGKRRRRNEVDRLRPFLEKRDKGFKPSHRFT